MVCQIKTTTLNDGFSHCFGCKKSSTFRYGLSTLIPWSDFRVLKSKDDFYPAENKQSLPQMEGGRNQGGSN